MDLKPLLPISVNGTVISAERIAAEAQNHPAPKAKPGHAWQAAARALAVREVLLQEARARGLRPAPVELAPGQVETEDEALVRQLLESAVRPEPPTEAALRAAYDAAPDRFRAPSLYEAAHILFAAAPDDPAARATAMTMAERVLEELHTSPRRFDRLAADYSACPSKKSGGRLGQITAGDTVPEFEAVLATLEEGALCPSPVATRYGVHIIRLDARAPGAVLPFDAVAPRLREAAEKAAWVRASRAFVASLVAQADIAGITMQAA